jgi:hypothetical protein
MSVLRARKQIWFGGRFDNWLYISDKGSIDLVGQHTETQDVPGKKKEDHRNYGS